MASIPVDASRVTKARLSDSRSTAGSAPAADGGCNEPFDLLAIGCGPFNLGLAALATKAPELRCVVLEAGSEMRWHPGLDFDHARLQVSFLADLVSLVDPAHPLSFLSYLREVERLYLFYVRESFHPTRREYDDYLRWAVGKLESIRFDHRVESVCWNPKRGCFSVDVICSGRWKRRFEAFNLVVGIGTEPFVPAALATGLRADAERFVLPAGSYLHRRDELGEAREVVLVGSGQSGAEIAIDLLERNLAGGPSFHWLTRTPSFAPLDYTKLVLEMTTPGYMQYFHGLEPATRDRLVAEQWRHYKGISSETIETIYELLYRRELEHGLAPVELRCGTSIEHAERAADGRVRLMCLHADTGRRFSLAADRVVAATGYQPRTPGFLAPLAEQIEKDACGRFEIRRDHSLVLDPAITGRIHVAHADIHSHGVSAPDLGVAPFRNAIILNAVAGREIYALPRRTSFTSFGPRVAAEACAEPVSRREPVLRESLA